MTEKLGELWQHHDGQIGQITGVHPHTKRLEVYLLGQWLPYDDLPALGWTRYPNEETQQQQP